jgi:tetratricopeptide (TPR) repeat protein
MRFHRPDLVIALILAAGSIAAFSPAFSSDFIGFDDPHYVKLNPHVKAGLKPDEIRWAWTSFYASNWHPLTWMSHQLDVTLFGAEAPGQYHAVNVLLHAASAVILFFALRALTGARWRSAIVAAFFAWHPLRVESVAWIAERKDVLSIFFGVLALWAYAFYVQRRSVWTYLLLAALFVLSLLAKPTLVTLPCLLLVLDWWPLARSRSLAERSVGEPKTEVPSSDRPIEKPTKTGKGGVTNPRRKNAFTRSISSASQTTGDSTLESRGRNWIWLVIEKLPLLAISLISCLLTYLAQQGGGSVRSFDTLQIGARVLNALVAYATYLGMAAWPVDLAPIYTYPQQGWPEWRWSLSLLVVVTLTALVIWQWRRRPYLLAGWLWYLGTMVPVIGIVQVGNQAYADRYTYFPFIGLGIAVVWGAAEAIPAARALQGLAFAAAVAAVLAVLTWRQTGFWKNDFTLWPHTLAVTGPNPQAYNSLGTAIETRDKNAKEAIKYYQKAVEAHRGFSTAHFNLARALKEQGDLKGALVHFEAAAKYDPHLPDAHNDWAVILQQQMNYKEAEEHFRKAISINPEMVLARNNLAHLLDIQGREKEAIELFQASLAINPNDAGAHTGLGVCLAKTGDLAGATKHFMRAVEIQPKWHGYWLNLGVTQEQAHNTKDAIQCFRRAVELEPNDVRITLRLANALTRIGNTADAEAFYRRADKLDPHWPDELRKLAWGFATSPDERKRDPEKAVWAAEAVCNGVRPAPAAYLDTLAAAYAAAGRFPDAIAIAEIASAAADAAHDADLSKAIASRLALYREFHPFRESASAGAGANP